MRNLYNRWWKVKMDKELGNNVSTKLFLQSNLCSNQKEHVSKMQNAFQVILKHFGLNLFIRLTVD